MNHWEKNLLTAQKWHSSHPNQSINAKEINIKYDEAEFLSAMGFLTNEFKDKAGNYFFKISDYGMTYFHRKKEQRKEFWKKYVLNFISGVVVGVLTTVTAFVITGHL